VNQKSPDLGIPNRFSINSSRFSGHPEAQSRAPAANNGN
jgi:hypothetical protein